VYTANLARQRMMGEYTICVATAADARPLARMRAAVARDMRERFGDGDWAAEPGDATVTRQIRASRVLVAKRGREIVGTLRLLTAQAELFDARAFTPVGAAVYAVGLAVAPASRGQGIGRDLLAAAKGSVRRWPADALWLDSYEGAAGVANYYRAQGFTEVTRGSHNGNRLVFFEWLAPP
jgi:GNAT superfamily N-acetyltransferase